MKYLFSLCTAVFAATVAFAQLPATTNSIALTKVVKVKEYRGWYFSASLDIKAVPSDSTGLAGTSMLQVGKKDWDFIKNTGGSVVAKKDTAWQRITLSGQIDPEADKLWIYLLTSGNGDFFFDNVELKVKRPQGDWQPVVIKNGDFDGGADPLADLKNTGSLKKAAGSYAVLKKESNSAHNNVLHIHTEGGMADTSIYYGYNYAAGTIRTATALLFIMKCMAKENRSYYCTEMAEASAVSPT